MRAAADVGGTSTDVLVYRHRMAGGGGWGNPLERDPGLVAQDVRNDKISAAGAREHYGVMLAAGGSVDGAGTQELRASRTGG